MSEAAILGAEELVKELSAKQRLFCDCFLKTQRNGTQAAIMAGYSEKGAAVTASRLLKRTEVKAYLEARSLEIFDALGLSKETLATALMEIYMRCMQAEPVMMWDSDKKEWVPSGEYRFNASGAVKALERIGDCLGIFKNKVELESKNPLGTLSVHQLEALISGLAEKEK